MARPERMLAHQRSACLFLEPWVGSVVSEERQRMAFVTAGDPHYVDTVISWAAFDNETDVPITYAYAAGLTSPLLTRDQHLPYEAYGEELRRLLQERFALAVLPVFDKDRFYSSLPRRDVEEPLDMRGGDVALFVSNCMDGIWRTEYLRILLHLLTDGYGLRVDSYGGCYHGIGFNRENHGQGWSVAEANDKEQLGQQQPEQPEQQQQQRRQRTKWSQDRRVTNVAQAYPDHYPRVKKQGERRGGVVKQEMLDHYKVTLNFENSLVHGYISEKFFQGLASESVAFYFGPAPAADYVRRDRHGRIVSIERDQRSAIFPHDTSNILDGWLYPNPLDMAERIHQLCTDQREWERHFEWRLVKDPARDKIQFRTEFIDLHRNDFTRLDHQNWICRTCELHDKRRSCP